MQNRAAPSPPSIENTTDAATIAASWTDPRRFEAVFDRHYDAVYRYAARRVGAALADDVAAETFTRAFAQRRRYDTGYADARPWLLGIAANLLMRHWRTERRRLEAYERAAGETPSLAGGEVRGSADLAAALDALSAGEREALLLFALGDLSYEEIALALGVRVGTVRSRLGRARARLRALLSPTGSTEARPKECLDA